MTPDPWYNRCRLHIGDYRETLALCNGAADIVLTSPPYADARTYGMGCNWTMDDYAALGDAVFAALRPGGHALINIDAPVREWRSGFGTERGFHAWEMMLDWGKRVGFRVPDRLAFGRLGTPGAYNGRFRNDWEPLLWFQKPGGKPWMDRASIASYDGTQKRSGGASNRRPDGTLYRRERSGWACENGATHRGSYWSYGSVGNGHGGAPDIEAENHPARWPYKLAEDIVRCFCPPDGLACDPFLGAGTSAAAALEHGRRFIGGDIGTRPAHKEKGLDEAPWAAVAFRVLQRRAEKTSLTLARR